MRPLSADKSGLGRQVATTALLLLFACLAWTLFWYLWHGASVLQAALTPWAAPLAWLHAPAGSAADPRLMLSGLAALALAGALAAAVFAPRSHPIYGDARFATRREIKAMGLLSPSGVLLGRLDRLAPAYLRDSGARHVLLAAPTRSGKGVGVVMPNLLSWPGSIVMLDVKNEGFEATSGFRHICGQRVFRLALGDATHCTHRYNPLDAVQRSRAQRIADLQAMAHQFLPEGRSEQPMWTQEARRLFVGIALYILDTPGLALTFGQVSRIVQANADLRDAFADVLEQRAAELDPACVNALASFIHKAPKERSGVKSELSSSLELWDDPAIDAATAASDFSLADLRRHPTTIYLSISPDQLHRLAPFLNIVFHQLVGVMMRHPPGADEPYPVLALIDEFASLGRMDLLVESMPMLAGYNIRLMLVLQSLAQLDRLYGSAGRDVILQNAAIQLFFAPNDLQTSNYVAERLGTTTVAQATRSRSTPTMGGGHGSTTHSTQLHPRPLMTADGVRRLAHRREIVFVEGQRPIAARKIVFHSDRRLAARVVAPVRVDPIAVPIHPPFRFDAPEAHGPSSAPLRSGAPEAYSPSSPQRRSEAAGAAQPTAAPAPGEAATGGAAAQTSKTPAAKGRSEAAPPPAPETPARRAQLHAGSDELDAQTAAELRRLETEIPPLRQRRSRSWNALLDDDS